MLAAVGGGLAEGYVEVDGVLRWPGERPGAGWRGHGWLPRTLDVFDGRELRSRRVYRHRWVLVGTTRTELSRCPYEIPRLWFAGTVVVLVLWAWLGGARGAHAAEPLHDALIERPSTRTAQRWLARALPRAGVLERLKPFEVQTHRRPRAETPAPEREVATTDYLAHLVAERKPAPEPPARQLAEADRRRRAAADDAVVAVLVGALDPAAFDEPRLRVGLDRFGPLDADRLAEALPALVARLGTGAHVHVLLDTFRKENP